MLREALQRGPHLLTCDSKREACLQGEWGPPSRWRAVLLHPSRLGWILAGLWKHRWKPKTPEEKLKKCWNLQFGVGYQSCPSFHTFLFGGGGGVMWSSQGWFARRMLKGQLEARMCSLQDVFTPGQSGFRILSLWGHQPVRGPSSSTWNCLWYIDINLFKINNHKIQKKPLAFRMDVHLSLTWIGYGGGGMVGQLQAGAWEPDHTHVPLK